MFTLFNAYLYVEVLLPTLQDKMLENMISLLKYDDIDIVTKVLKVRLTACNNHAF